MTYEQLHWEPEGSTPLDNFVCAGCGHPAARHTVHTGPCADCWAQLLPICERFLLKAEDVATVEALDF